MVAELTWNWYVTAMVRIWSEKAPIGKGLADIYGVTHLFYLKSYTIQ